MSFVPDQFVTYWPLVRANQPGGGIKAQVVRVDSDTGWIVILKEGTSVPVRVRVTNVSERTPS
jgi:hypothetical protein